jgi:hypothetical protein
MNLRIRTGVLAAGAVALLSAQAVHAAPVPNSVAVDPLVSLSALGTVQSRAAVCAAGTTAAVMAGAAAVQAAPPGCVLPVTGPAAPMAQPVAPPPYYAPVGPAPGKEIGLLPILGGLAVLGIVAALLLRGDRGEGILTPVTPISP